MATRFDHLPDALSLFEVIVRREIELLMDEGYSEEEATREAHYIARETLFEDGDLAADW